MSPEERTRLSKFMSLALRHWPDAAGIALDAAGWVGIDDLLAGCLKAGFSVDRADIEEVVRTSDKQRFALCGDRNLIRAQQGHSVSLDLGYQPTTPPGRLFHGTVARNLESIRQNGLRRGARTHVHLSDSIETATAVGGRRGKPVIIEINSARMNADGYQFFHSPNGVWLTESVPPQYLTIPPAAAV